MAFNLILNQRFELMASKYKTTGCARFFLFLVIFIPAVYFGLKYFDDRGQLDEWRDKLDLDKKTSTVEEILERKGDGQDSEFDTQQVKRQLSQLLQKIEEQNQIIADQEETIKKQQDIIDQLSGGSQEKVNTPEQAKPPTSEEASESLEELLKAADKALKKNGS